MFLEIFGDGVEPLLRLRRKRSGTAEPELRCQRTSEEIHFGSPQGQTMIRGRTGDAGRRLDNIEPVHRVSRAIQLAAPREFSRVADVSRAAAQEIGIERKDNVSLLRPVNRVEVVAKGKLRTLARAVADGRLPLVPLGLRKKCQERLNLCGKRRRSDDTCQDAETRAVRGIFAD